MRQSKRIKNAAEDLTQVKFFLTPRELAAYDEKLQKIGGSKRGPYAKHLILIDLGLKASS